MDTVEGFQGKNQSVLLTLQIVSIKFLFLFKIDQKTFANVLQQLLLPQSILEQGIFTNLFKILLIENGIEFYDIPIICDTFPEINLFYCHLYSSYEKGNIENNHELLRKIIPKGVSLNPYTQKDFNLICSHINSLYRKELDDKEIKKAHLLFSVAFTFAIHHKKESLCKQVSFKLFIIFYL